MKFLLPVAYLLFSYSLSAQQQTCPPNSNFSDGTLTYWGAYTGNNANGNGPSAIADTFSAYQNAPFGTIGATSIDEYQLAGTKGIQVISSASIDPFGGFTTLPVINGYRYNSAVLLGSTSVSRNSGPVRTQGGYIRGISYLINVPLSPSTQPYTMTYAYAMVLENGTHNSINQPLFTATLSTNDSVIICASPKYFLPTLNNASGSNGATLDSATAIEEGFTVSNRASPNPNSTNSNGGFLYDVWWKGWTEVTFDLSPYRGQVVKLTFEADNCTLGGHFAYAYIALRNTCDGLVISGDTTACTNSTMTYSIPALGGANYNWSVPPDWTIVSGSQSNILKVNAGTDPGFIIAHEVNGCANLRATMNVTALTPTVPGFLSGDARVCTGINSSPLLLNSYTGNILGWIASTNGGAAWTPVLNTAPGYTAQNLSATTLYKAIVQDGEACDIDTSAGSTVLVDPKSVGGTLLPADQVVCTNQFKGAVLNLAGSVGDVLNWQSSLDTVNWVYFAPVDTAKTFNIVGITVSNQYRLMVKSGVCPVDTSSIAYTSLVPALFPQASAEPADTTICYGATAMLNALITLGTNYSWSSMATLGGSRGNGNIPSTPFSIHETATPLKTTDYVLTIQNAGCPNVLLDTFDVHVLPAIVVNAGNDTSVVINQPLQFSAVSNEPGDSFTWTPATGLDNPDIADPIGLYGAETDSVRYLVKAQSTVGCFGLAEIVVKIFKTAPDIFIPNAFTPGKSSNTIFRPIAVGLSSIQYFRIYNRWGQLVFSTTVPGQGWDGSLGGKPQEPGTYVWMVKGTSYTGKPIFKKGFMVLIR